MKEKSLHTEREKKKKEILKMDESGIEPETSPMLRERATDYATRP